MPTLNIYIPDDLAKALEAHKAQMNVSRVCADALREETRRLELLEKGKEDRSALLERLRIEKRETLASVRQDGREWAEEWVKQASYGELKEYGEQDDGSERPMSTEQYYDDYFRLPDYVAEEVQRHELEQAQQGEAFDWAAFKEGWHEYVREFWEEVKDKI